MEGIIRAWGKILAGYQPSLSIEITRECPLTCPGCYAYGGDHLGGDVTLRELQDFKGQELIDAMFTLLAKYRPLHVSIVGGEPLVRYRELSQILPRMAKMGIYTQVVTSAVRQIPLEWAGLRRLQLVVSIDGLQPEHDERRKPATYERILKHIEGHDIRVHCTVTRQQVRREGYLEEFVKFWSANPAVSQIWISLYTPQVGELSAERLTKADRQRVVEDLLAIRLKYPKLRTPKGMLESYVVPPHSPADCIFAKTTVCVSSNFQKPITPCQFGGNPDCANCGCIASATLAAVGRHTLPGGIRVGTLFDHSFRIGAQVKAIREAVANGRPEKIASSR
jgi:MoaA/NifB/PqqE/SkfB family radical SAM enzyme